MFVPLDQLYTFLNQLIDDDAVIYRLYPHGSRKISDLGQLNHYAKMDNWQERLNTVSVLAHDQEPLNFDFYSTIDADEIQLWTEKNAPDLFRILEKHDLFRKALELFRSWNLALFSGNTLSDHWILTHSEKRSHELEKYSSIGAIGVYWWSHAMIARDWYRFACVDRRLCDFGPSYQKDFNVYNRAWTGTREYRLKFAEMLVQQDLVTNTQIALSRYDGDIFYQDYIAHNPKFQLEKDISMLPAKSVCSSSSADYSCHDYHRCAIDVVLETLFDDTRLHLTEKTLRPIACGKPFILLSTPGALDLLRDYGFQTFGDYIDENYDQISDPVTRLHAVIASMKNIARRPPVAKNTLYQQLHRIAQKNREIFWSADFSHRILQEFQQNYAAAYDICKSTQQGQRWYERRRALAQLDPALAKWVCEDMPGRSRRDLMMIMMKVKYGFVK